ncbi:hypothetical protein, partial [Enterococcus mundtii]
FSFFSITIKKQKIYFFKKIICYYFIIEKREIIMDIKLFFTIFLLIVSLQFSSIQVYAEVEVYQSFKEMPIIYYNQIPHLDENQLKEYKR